MSVNLTINGTTYAYPEQGDSNWGVEATGWAQAVTSGMLQKAGGTFQLLAEVDFGTGFGIKSLYYKSRTANVASAGQIRLARADVISFRNEANSADLDLSVNSSDQLLFNGVSLAGVATVSDTSTIDLTITGVNLTADIVALSIDNSLISTSAAIAYSKLAALTASRALQSSAGGVIEVATTTSTELGYVSGVTSSIQTQLNGKQATGNYITALTGDVVATGPGSVAATIQAGVITNSMINVSAAIAYSKLAALTVSRALVSDGSGFVSAATTTATEIGYVNGVTSAIQTQLDAKQLRSTLTAKGDLYVATASNTVARQAVGSNGQVLTANSALTNGIEWTTPTDSSLQSYAIQNLGISATVAASALTVAIKTAAGSDASASDTISVGFRNATAGTGQFSKVSISSALSFVVSSGSTLGQENAKESNLYVYLINNAGTPEIAVSLQLFNDGSIVSTTAEGGAGGADSATAIYSTTARTNVALRLVGLLVNTQATAGTWATNPSTISLVPFFKSSISEIVVITSPGTASTASRILYFSTVLKNTGSPYITYTSDSVNGDKFTVNKTGIYSVYLQIQSSDASREYGITLNQTSLVTNITSNPEIQILGTDTNIVDRRTGFSVTAFLNSGDVIRANTDGGTISTLAGDCRFGIKFIK